MLAHDITASGQLPPSLVATTFFARHLRNVVNDLSLAAPLQRGNGATREADRSAAADRSLGAEIFRKSQLTFEAF